MARASPYAMSFYSTRLKSFDYLGEHRYTLTLCTVNRRPDLTDGDTLREARTQLQRAADLTGFAIPVFCFMPDHLHILAIGAAKFGATDIDAVDIDDAAVESTRLNAEANGVGLRAGLPDAARGSYQVVLANILATPLKVLAPLLCQHVAPGGALVLAGILDRQAQELKDAYAPHLQLEVSDSEDGWILMTARR